MKAGLVKLAPDAPLMLALCAAIASCWRTGMAAVLIRTEFARSWGYCKKVTVTNFPPCITTWTWTIP